MTDNLLSDNVTVATLLGARLNAVIQMVGAIDSQTEGLPLAIDVLTALREGNSDAVLAFRTAVLKFSERAYSAEGSGASGELAHAMNGVIGILRDYKDASANLAAEEDETEREYYRRDRDNCVNKAIAIAVQPHGVYKKFAAQ